MRTTVKKGVVKPGEIVLEMEVEVPEHLFHRPVLKTKITIPSGHHEGIITAETIANIQEILDDKLSLQVEIVRL